MGWDIEWEREGRNFDGINVGRQLTSEYYIISQCTHINEAITRRWLGALSPLFFSFAFYTNMICSCCCSRLVVIIAFFLTASLLRSLWALFVYERGIKNETTREAGDDKWILWNATKKARKNEAKLELTSTSWNYYL